MVKNDWILLILVCAIALYDVGDYGSPEFCFIKRKIKLIYEIIVTYDEF